MSAMMLYWRPTQAYGGLGRLKVPGVSETIPRLRHVLTIFFLDRATFFTDEVRRDFLEEMGRLGSFGKSFTPCSYMSLIVWPRKPKTCWPRPPGPDCIPSRSTYLGTRSSRQTRYTVSTLPPKDSESGATGPKRIRVSDA